MKTIQDPDFPCEALPLIAAVLPLKNGYFVIVGQDGAVYRLHRQHVAKIVSDGNGRITEIQLASRP
jgi:hypothetical protein